MLDTLITSKTRMKLLLKFFLNSKSSSYLRSLQSEFGESSNGIRIELNRFEKAGLLKTNFKGNKKLYQANTEHPLFNEIHNLLIKNLGFDQIIDTIINKLGKLFCVCVVGDFARGKDTHIIDLLFVGNSINQEYLIKLITKTENIIKRKIRYLVFNEKEFEDYATKHDESEVLILWKE